MGVGEALGVGVGLIVGVGDGFKVAEGVAVFAGTTDSPAASTTKLLVIVFTTPLTIVLMVMVWVPGAKSWGTL